MHSKSSWNFKETQAKSCKEKYLPLKEEKNKRGKLRRNASLEIILENGKMNSHRNFKSKIELSPHPEINEAAEIKITKTIMNTIK